MDLNLSEISLEGKLENVKKVEGGIIISFDVDKKIFLSDEEMIKMIKVYG